MMGKSQRESLKTQKKICFFFFHKKFLKIFHRQLTFPFLKKKKNFLLFLEVKHILMMGKSQRESLKTQKKLANADMRNC